MRRFATFLGIFVVFLLIASACYPDEGNPETYSLRSARQVGQIDQVNARLDVQGDKIEKTGPKGEKSEKTPMTLTYTRDYDEKTVSLGDGVKPWQAFRYYNDATATVKLGENVHKPLLRPERRLIAIHIAGSKVTSFCPAGLFYEEELEMVNAFGNSLPLDALLPKDPVAIGKSWKAGDEIMAILLDLEEVTANTTQVVLQGVTDDLARMELDGHVEGKYYGEATHIDLKAKCRFDRKANRIDWFAMRVKQSHDVGIVEAGLDVTVLLQMKITPKESSERLTEAALKDLSPEPLPAQCRVIYESDEGGWSIAHDRSWFVHMHARDLDVLNRVEHGQHIALCKISRLPKTDPTKRLSLADYQENVREALKEKFGAIVEATETSQAEHRVYRVVVKGTDNDQPTQWHYYLVRDGAGRQAALVFHVDEKQLEAFGKAGDELVESLRFVEKKEKEAGSGQPATGGK
jgi:hypothetical protein